MARYREEVPWTELNLHMMMHAYHFFCSKKIQWSFPKYSNIKKIGIAIGVPFWYQELQFQQICIRMLAYDYHNHSFVDLEKKIFKKFSFVFLCKILNPTVALPLPMVDGLNLKQSHKFYLCRSWDTKHPARFSLFEIDLQLGEVITLSLINSSFPSSKDDLCQSVDDKFQCQIPDTSAFISQVLAHG